MDPCEAAAKASQNCMERTHYNRDEVSAYIPAQGLAVLTFPNLHSVSRFLSSLQRLQILMGALIPFLYFRATADGKRSWSNADKTEELAGDNPMPAICASSML
jgi:hypothetical protein